MLEKTRTGTISLSKFYARRVLRIWPLYFTILVVVFVLGRYYPPAAFSNARLAAFFLLSGNWYSLMNGPGTPFISSLWSISVEEQFYLFWPWIGKLNHPRAIVRVLCAVCILVSLSGTWLLAKHGSTAQSLWFNSLSEILFFAVGAILALYLDFRKIRSSYKMALVSCCIGMMCWFWSVIYSQGSRNIRVTPTDAVGGYVLDAVGCGCFLVSFLWFPDDRIPDLLVYLGRISYGLYVFHRIMLEALNHLLGHGDQLPVWLKIGSKGLAFLFTVGAASLSYRFLEKPFLGMKRRFEVVRTR